MIAQFVLGVAGLISNIGFGSFSEQSVILEPTETTIQSETVWNAFTVIVPDEPFPTLEYKNGNQWVAIPEAEDDDQEQELQKNTDQEQVSISKIISFDALREEITLRSETQMPVRIHFYNTKNQTENLTAQAGITDFDTGIDFRNFEFGDSLLDGVEITDFQNHTLMGNFNDGFRPQYITRAGWGADETLRIWQLGRGLKNYFRSAPAEAKEYLKKEEWPQVITKSDSDGNKLTWPIEENQSIKKIIIHHTGEYIDDTTQMRRTPREHMRAIYQYHTLSKQWGDIGYNFVIDKMGNIYEGRAGGPKAVGAHVAYYNVGTIGIALMGNFNVEEPTDAQLKVLTILTAYLSDKYNIDVEQRTDFLGIESENITGHRFVARQGHGTACPGINMIKRLPNLRKATKDILKQLSEQREGMPSGLDFLGKSSTAPQIQRRLPRFVRKEKIPLITQGELLNREILQRGSSKIMSITFKNNSNKTWDQYSTSLITNAPEGMQVTPFKAVHDIAPGEEGEFKGVLTVNSTVNGRYDLKLDPIFLKDSYFSSQDRPHFQVPIQVSGSRNFFNPRTQNISADAFHHSAYKKFNASAFRDGENFQQKEVKVKLAFLEKDFLNIRANRPLFIKNKNRNIAELNANEQIQVIWKSPKTILLTIQDKEWNLDEISLMTEGQIELMNYNRGLSQKIKYNQFRRRINIHPQAGQKLLVVNQLPIEEYLAGLSEQPETEPDQKKHAIHILARSYAYVYSGERRKFRTHLYDLEDDPRTSQFYLGYDWERIHQHQKNLLKETEGLMLTYNNKPVIGPYFTQSSGYSSDKWSHQYPWAQARELPYDKGLIPRGHGVGLSGHSAHVLADKGKSYQEILDYFFVGTEIKKIY
jgi:hypothetical protein